MAYFTMFQPAEAPVREGRYRSRYAASPVHLLAEGDVFYPGHWDAHDVNGDIDPDMLYVVDTLHDGGHDTAVCDFCRGLAEDACAVEVKRGAAYANREVVAFTFPANGEDVVTLWA